MKERFKIVCVGGTRPNFVKLGPLVKALKSDQQFEVKLVHTGQHYDHLMGGDIQGQFGLPSPDANLDTGSGPHGWQTGRMMMRFESVLMQMQPHVVVVVGDVNSTVACALSASKFVLEKGFNCLLGKRSRPIVAHVEAGLRSFDNNMPEEINRKVTDAVSDVHYVSEQSGIDNLRAEGVADSSIILAGSLNVNGVVSVRSTPAYQNSRILETLSLQEKKYGLLTLHRPENVDCTPKLVALLDALDEIATQLPIAFPVHPRTVIDSHIPKRKGDWHLSGPLPYADFIQLLSKATVVLTDSGGVQEESTWLMVPCLTLRDTTERPVTVERGTNYLAGTEREKVLACYRDLATDRQAPRAIPYWDGSAAHRIAEHLARIGESLAA